MSGSEVLVVTKDRKFLLLLDSTPPSPREKFFRSPSRGLVSAVRTTHVRLRCQVELGWCEAVYVRVNQCPPKRLELEPL